MHRHGFGQLSLSPPPGSINRAPVSTGFKMGLGTVRCKGKIETVIIVILCSGGGDCHKPLWSRIWTFLTRLRMNFNKVITTMVIRPPDDRTYCGRSAFTNFGALVKGCTAVQCFTSQPANVSWTLFTFSPRLTENGQGDFSIIVSGSDGWAGWLK